MSETPSLDIFIKEKCKNCESNPKCKKGEIIQFMCILQNYNGKRDKNERYI